MLLDEFSIENIQRKKEKVLDGLTFGRISRLKSRVDKSNRESKVLVRVGLKRLR